MNNLFRRLAGGNSPRIDSSEKKTEAFHSFEIPRDNPFIIAQAYHARRGEKEKIDRIKEYLFLQDKRDIGDEYNMERFDALRTEISEEYLLHTDAETYLEDRYQGTNAGSDFKNRYDSLRMYLYQFSSASADEAVRAGMDRSADANRRRRGYAQSLQKEVREGQKFWTTEGEKWEGGEYLEQNFPDMLQRSLDVTIGRINTAIRLGRDIADGNKDLSDEYVKSMQRINHFLDTFNDREDVSIIDLMYYIDEHRDSTTFRNSTSGYYSEYEALVSGLVHTMPSRERQREDVDLIHHCVDPEYNDLSHAMELSYLNVKHDIGLTTQDIDIYSATTSIISDVMRAFEVPEMDDRPKQQFHNSGDHSLRVILTVVSIRDTNISRFERMYEQGDISEDRLQRLTEMSYETSAYLCKMACLHDSGEYLGELLGNNLVGRSVLEERLLRALRDQTEEHIMKTIVPEELHYRLNQGETAERWKGRDVREYIKNSLKPKGSFDFSNKFHDMLFDIFERLQTNHDIISLRSVGRINHEGQHQNAENASDDDVLYTMQYVYSKITGHKFHTTDPADISDFHATEYRRKRALADYHRSNKVAMDTHAPLPYVPEVTRIQDLPNTSLPLETFMEERQIDFDKSLFGAFVGQALEHYDKFSQEEAEIRQMNDEAWIHGVCYEMNHYARKLAKSSDIDRFKIDKATRKSIAQGVLVAQGALREQGGELRYLELPDQILDKQRYRVLSVNSTTFKGGVHGRLDKPNQLKDLFGFQDVFKFLGDAVDNLRENILSPLWSRVQTPVQALTLIDLAHVTEKDFKRLFQISSALELGGDLSYGVTGLAESSSDFGADFSSSSLDPKILASLNPLLTWSLAVPNRYADAARKCYGHVLHMHSDKIAEKYGLEDAIDYLKTRENLKKGPFYRKPTDLTLSGDVAEQMYNYLSAQYSGRDVGEDAKYGQKQGVKRIAKAEKYILSELIQTEIAKTVNRLMQEVSPAQKDAADEKLAILKNALRNPQLKGDRMFKAKAKYAMEIRFGSQGGLGMVMSQSGTGSDIADLPVVGTVTTSHVLGLNLARMGFSGMGAAMRDRSQTLPLSNVINKMRDLPHFERGKDGGAYIVKGASHKVMGASHEDNESLIKDMVKARQDSPNIMVQLLDMVIAVPVSAVRALTTRSTSKKAIEDMNMAQTVDTTGVVASAVRNSFSVANNPVSAGLKAASAVSAMMFFRRVGVLSTFMHEIQEDLKNGKDPDFQTIKDRIEDQLRHNASDSDLNWLENKWRAQQGNIIGRAGNIFENIMYNDLTGKAVHAILDYQYDVKPEEKPSREQEPT